MSEDAHSFHFIPIRSRRLGRAMLPDEVSGGVKVLIVDDELLVRKSLARFFRQRGHEDVMAESGDDALRMAARADIDAIVVDWVLPGLSGLEVTRMLRARRPAADRRRVGPARPRRARGRPRCGGR